jgi:hypothetical protein
MTSRKDHAQRDRHHTEIVAKLSAAFTDWPRERFATPEDSVQAECRQ